ncbi:MAG: GDSL-type esterase/lipase family protein [Fibrobacteraceae bacterium]|nr:GDSL-type esterase/lipase family protein [Fibrobacteraceae bacterium]
MKKFFFIFLFSFSSLPYPLLAKVNVACVGNSITYGYGLAWGDTTYPMKLGALLGDADTVFNFGVSGTTMLKSGNSPYWSQNKIDSVRSVYPANTIIIELGTNDVKTYNWYQHQEEFTEDYISMLDTFRTISTNPRIWMTLAPYGNNAGWGMYDTSLTLRINPAILEVALSQGMNLIDLHSTFKTPVWFLEDSIHPNATGAKELAKIIYSYMLRDTLKVTQNGSVLTAPAGYGYQWYKDDVPLENETDQTLSISSVGKYKVSIKVDDTTSSRIVSDVLTVSDITAVGNIRILQNTISFKAGLLRVSLSRVGNVNVRLLDVQGRQLASWQFSAVAGENLFEIPQVKGPFVISVSAGNGRASLLLVNK